jgi:hypothetical protein
MLFKPLKDADVRKAESAAAFERDADGGTVGRLDGRKCGANGGRRVV